MSTDSRPPLPPVVRSRAAAALLPKFFGNRERDVVAIGMALEQGDFETVSRLGHNMRGNGASYGFPEISALGERLEAAARARDHGRACEELTSLVAWIAARRRTGER